MSDTKATIDENAGRPTVWMDVGHIAPQAEGAFAAAGWKPNTANAVLVYADNGAVVNPQPDYPVAPDVPADGVPLDPETGAPAAAPAKASAPTTKSTSPS